MPADKNIWMIAGYEVARLEVVFSGPSADVHHQNFLLLTHKTLVFRIHHTNILTIAVSVHSDERLKICNSVGEIDAPSEIPGVPDLVHRSQEILELLAENTVSV